jgi:hypothetical protein
MEGVEMEGQVVEGGEDGGTMEDLFGGDPDPDMDKMIERQTSAFAERCHSSARVLPEFTASATNKALREELASNKSNGLQVNYLTESLAFVSLTFFSDKEYRVCGLVFRG